LWLAPNLLGVTPRPIAQHHAGAAGAADAAAQGLRRLRRLGAEPCLVERLGPRLRSRVLSKVGLRPFSTSA
jgi:hypothetical protein